MARFAGRRLRSCERALKYQGYHGGVLEAGDSGDAKPGGCGRLRGVRSFPMLGSVCLEILCMEMGLFGAWEWLRGKRIGPRMNTNSHEFSLDFSCWGGLVAVPSGLLALAL